MKPERHVWDEGSTHRAVAGKEYDEVWDYAEELEAELEKIICHWCEAEVTEDEANEHYKSCTKNPLRAENEALKKALHQEDHFIVFTDDGWSLQHLVSCRPDMTTCEVHQQSQIEFGGNDSGLRGRFKVWMRDGVLELEEDVLLKGEGG